MSQKQWVLTDVDQDVHVEQLILGSAEMGPKAQGCSVRKRTLRGGPRDGVDVIEIDNGKLKATVLPTRGMGLWRVAAGDVEIGWKSPARGPVHPKFVRLWEPSGLGWLAGFDELLCRCGLESNGGPVVSDSGVLEWPLHGKIANLPAHYVSVAVDDQTGEIAVQGVVDEARLYHNKLQLISTVRTNPGELGLRITDEVVNLSAEPGELELVYHTNFGSPLLEAGSKVVVPAKTVVPFTPRAAEGVSTWDVYGPPEIGFTEQVYAMELLGSSEGTTQALLRNAHGNLGASLHFNTRQLPCFTLWKSTQMEADGYVTGLEPGVNYPNTRTFEVEHDRVARLAGGERRSFDLRLEIHVDAAGVAQAEQAIRKLASQPPKVYERPTKPWAREG